MLLQAKFFSLVAWDVRNNNSKPRANNAPQFFACKASELNKNAGRMNKSLICEIAIAHNYGTQKREFQEAQQNEICQFFSASAAFIILATSFFRAGQSQSSYIKK